MVKPKVNTFFNLSNEVSTILRFYGVMNNMPISSKSIYIVKNITFKSKQAFVKLQNSYSTMISRRLFTDDDDMHKEADDNLFLFMTPERKRPGTYLDDDDTSDLRFNTPVTNKHLSTKQQIENKRYKKCPSVCDDMKMAVNKLSICAYLIADGSRTHILPTIPGKHQDLKSISPGTLADVIEGGYDDVIDSYRIIDCRYPYEFEGGHIKEAENRYLHETILDLLRQPTTERQIIIFHCEFSSERGPKMLRFLRSKDRELNKENYPALNFPEIYLLDGGYKEFFNEHPKLCDPVSYRPMLHSEHSADLRHFRAKSKSWTAGVKRRQARRAIRI